MTDHETFLLLAAKRIGEPMSAEDEAALEAHLAGCPSCRSIAAGMRRDDIRLRAEVSPEPVSPRVRRRVLDEAAGRRRVDPRLILGLVAAVVLGAIGAPFVVGTRVPATPSPFIPTPSAAIPSISATTATTPSPTSSLAAASPSTAPVASPSPTDTPFVVGNYVYGATPPRRDTLSAHVEGGPVGEWSRRTPATGDSTFYGGPVTCLVISGSDAWLAGPATTATDGKKDLAAFIHVHDGGLNGKGDTAYLWLSQAGQTIVTMTDWCERRFVPGDGLPLTSGDLVVREGP
jgi:hypothetical protein